MPIAAADRLSSLDAMFLHVETLSSPMHVGMVCRIEGAPLRKKNGALDRERLHRQTLSRLDKAPRFRQRVLWPPFGQGRPIWVDDTHFNIAYHVRFTGLPRPGGASELKLLAGRVLSQNLDRSRPLWEMYWVDGLENDEVGLIWKVHHCMVDGVSGVEVATLLFDLDPHAKPAPPPKPWKPRPSPNVGALLGNALAESAALSRRWFTEARSVLVNPEGLAKRLREDFSGFGTWLGKGLAPRTIFNVAIGPHRRVDWAMLDLTEVKRIKNVLGGTINDVALAVVAGGVRRFLSHRGEQVSGVELHVGIPVSVRRADEKQSLGNRVSAIAMHLPVGEPDPLERHRLIRERTELAKRGFAASAAETLTNLPGGPPGTLLQQVARMQWAQRVLNLVVTNVPGPQTPLYVAGARLLDIAPFLPLGPNVALGIAVLSYAGQLGFGLIADYDVLHDVDVMATALRDSFDELSRAAGSPRRAGTRATAPARGQGGPAAKRRAKR